MKLTEAKLKEMVRKIVKEKLLNEAVKEKDMPEAWVKYMKEVEDFLSETVSKMKELAEKGEEIKAKERELDKTANPVNSSRTNYYQYVDERVVALKHLSASLAQKLEAWRTKYQP